MASQEVKNFTALKNYNGDVIYSANVSSVGKALEKAAKEGVELRGLYLKDVEVSGSLTKKLNLDNLKAPDAAFENVKFSGVSMKNADLTNTLSSGLVFKRADLEGTDLSKVQLVNRQESAYFKRCNLVGTSISKTPSTPTEQGRAKYEGEPFDYIADAKNSLGEVEIKIGERTGISRYTGKREKINDIKLVIQDSLKITKSTLTQKDTLGLMTRNASLKSNKVDLKKSMEENKTKATQNEANPVNVALLKKGAER